MHTCPVNCFAPAAVNELYGPAQDEYVWQKERKKKAPNWISSPFNAQGRFTRSLALKISLNTSCTTLLHCWSKQGLRNERQSKASRGGLGWGWAALQLTSRGQNSTFSIIIGSRYVQGMRLHGNLLTPSVDNKRWGSYQAGRSDTECINIYVALSSAFVSSPECPLCSFLLNAVQHFAYSPLTVWTAAEENNDQTKSLVHVLHKKVAHFLKVGQTLPWFSQKLNINEPTVS